MTEQQPAGAFGFAIPLPDAGHLKAAILAAMDGQIDLTGLDTAHLHPLGERAVASQYLGVLKGIVAQMESPLRGGPLGQAFVNGHAYAYQGVLSALLLSFANEATFIRASCRAGIDRFPEAERQLRAAAIALDAARHALGAAAEIAVGADSPDLCQAEIDAHTAAMYAACDDLTNHAATTR